MKFRNQFLKYKVHSMAEDGTGGGTGDANQQQPNGNEQQQNNKDVTIDDFSNIWDNTSQAEENQQGQQNFQQPPQQQSAEDIFNNHVNTLNLGASAGDLMAAMQSQDPEQIATALQANNAQVYRSAMIDANKMVDSRIDAIRDEMQTNTDNTIKGNTIIAQMENALPYTKNGAYAPMAKAVISQLLEKPGMTTENAIVQTGKYFEKFVSDVQSTQQTPPGSKPKGGFGNGQDSQNLQNGNQADEPNWFEFLGGKSE